MRLFKINLLAVALLVFSVATASAYRVDLVSSDFGTTIAPGDLISIDVVLDTEGGANMLLVGLGVLFDESVFTYRQDLSSNPTYLFYVTAKQPWLIPASTCTPVCGINGIISNQVQIDWISTALTTPAGAAGTGLGTLATLVFQATGSGIGGFDFQVIDGNLSTVFQLGDLSEPPLTLGPGGTVVVPEPTTALLVGLGLVGLGVAGRRSRS